MQDDAGLPCVNDLGGSELERAFKRKPDGFPGQLGRFEVHRRLGGGGMGQVFLDWDPGLRRNVASKSDSPAVGAHPEVRARLVHEARLLSALEHPGTCRIHDYVQGEDVDHLVLGAKRVDASPPAASVRRPADVVAVFTRLRSARWSLECIGECSARITSGSLLSIARRGLAYSYGKGVLAGVRLSELTRRYSLRPDSLSSSWQKSPSFSGSF